MIKMDMVYLPASSNFCKQQVRQPLPIKFSSEQRLHMVEFVIQSAQQLELAPIVKYSALSLFVDRFFQFLPRFRDDGKLGNWLLRPVRESNMQLFALISILVSSKIHDSRPLSVRSLKSLADDNIKEQHFTTRDFQEAVLNFEIGTANIVYMFLEELWIQIKEVTKLGELINFGACMEIMDLLYDKEETSFLYRSPVSLASSILVASYAITVPKREWEFPVLSWVKFVTSCKEEDIINIVRDILKHVFEPSSHP